MYGTFIVDPKAGRPPADELVLVQHGYNTTFDGQGNQLYAVNGIPFVYMLVATLATWGEQGANADDLDLLTPSATEPLHTLWGRRRSQVAARPGPEG